MESQGSALARTIGRVLVLAVAVSSLVVLLDAGAKYPGATWHTVSSYARRLSALGLEVAPPGAAPLEFRLSGNLPVERGQKGCAVAPSAESASQGGDESFDINCTDGPTVKAVSDLPHAELLSWPGDSMYHRALRF